MKILFITYNLGRTASGIVSERILREFIAAGNDVVVLTADNSASKLDCDIYELSQFMKQGSLLYRVWYYLIAPMIMVDIFNGNVFWRFRAYRCARKILKKWVPDCVYCRTSPTDPCFVGLKLKIKFNVPLVVNLTDPLPAPLEYIPEGKLRRKLISDAKTIIAGSDAIMMGTNQAIDYECKISGLVSKYKFTISPDPVPFDKVIKLPNTQSAFINLLYLGSIYGSRDISKLISVVEALRIEGKNVKLTICSDPSKSAPRKEFIFYSGWVSDVLAQLSNADILIDIDGDDKEPMFVSSKLKQYLCVNRPILSITPQFSPSYELLKDLNTATTCINTFDHIYGALKSILDSNDELDYDKDRENLLKQLSSKYVTDNILETIRHINNV